jgi:hypothetical protein
LSTREVRQLLARYEGQRRREKTNTQRAGAWQKCNYSSVAVATLPERLFPGEVLTNRFAMLRIATGSSPLSTA